MTDQLTAEEVDAVRTKEQQEGPLSIQYQAVVNKKTIMINCRNNKKQLAQIKAYDRHCNMILLNVHELWTDVPKRGKGTAKANPVMNERFISKMFLRGDSVITVISDPN